MASERVRKLLDDAKALRWRRDFDAASARFIEAQHVAHEEGDLSSVATALVWRSIVLQLQTPSIEAATEALALQRQALAIEERLSPLAQGRQADTLRVMADTLEAAGEKEAALEAARRSIELFESLRLRSLPVEGAYATFTRLARDLGRHAEARTAAAKLIEVCGALESPLRLIAAHMEAGQAALSLELTEEALHHFEEVLRIAEPRIRLGQARRLVAEVNVLIEQARSPKGPAQP